jgi:hypothetical protein
MKDYVVRKTAGGIVVWHDGERIELKGLYDAIAEPKYDMGNNSDSTMNLGYAILRDCVGEVAAFQLYEEFSRIHLMREIKEVSIPVDDILDWAKGMAKMMSAAQTRSGWKDNTP